MSIHIESDNAEVNGTRLYYEMAGSGEPLLLVHGGGGDRRHWDGQFSALAEQFHVVRYDLRGYGKSAAPVEGQAYRHEDDLKALLGALGISQAHIAGFSLGCQVVVDAYTLYPDLFKSIIAVGPFVSGHSGAATEHLFGGYGDCGAVYLKDGQGAAAESFANMPAFNPDKIDDAPKALIAQICRDFTWWSVGHNDPMEHVSPPATEKLGDIAVPLLIISAEHDAAACREVADLMEEKVPGGRRSDISGASHFMLMEKPAVFNATVEAFLNAL